MREARADDGRVNDDLVTFLAIVDTKTGCMRAMVSETKGATDYPASSVADFVKNLCVGRFGLRCGNEPSIMAVAEKVKAKMPDRVVVETSPRHSSASNGLEERANRTMGEQLGNLRYDTQNRCKTRITPYAVIWPWIVSYAGFLCHEIRTWSGWHHAVPGSARPGLHARDCSVCRNCLVQDVCTRTSWIVVRKETP